MKLRLDLVATFLRCKESKCVEASLYRQSFNGGVRDGCGVGWNTLALLTLYNSLPELVSLSRYISGFRFALAIIQFYQINWYNPIVSLMAIRLSVTH
jgi:hypothetical protein